MSVMVGATGGMGKQMPVRAKEQAVRGAILVTGVTLTVPVPVVAVVAVVDQAAQHLMAAAGAVLAFVDKVPVVLRAPAMVPVVQVGEAAALQRAVVPTVLVVIITILAVATFLIMQVTEEFVGEAEEILRGGLSALQLGRAAATAEMAEFA